MYFPLSANREDLFGIKRSNNLLVFPIIVKNKPRMHVTLFMEENLEGLDIDIHVKKEEPEEKITILKKTIPKETVSTWMNKWSERFLKNALETAKLLKEHYVRIPDSEMTELYCVECSGHFKIPKRSKQAKEFWDTIETLTIENTEQEQRCTNENHRTYYHPTRRIMIHQMKEKGMFFVHDRRAQQVMDELWEKEELAISKEMALFEDIFTKIKEAIEQLR